MKHEFIAWDKEKKRWLSANDFAVDGDGITYSIQGDATFPIKNVDIYPYTGRKDRDGKKVYEGSIVSDGIKTREVVYNEVDMGWYLKRNGLLWKLCAEDFNWNKVIGHIAEGGKG